MGSRIWSTCIHTAPVTSHQPPHPGDGAQTQHFPLFPLFPVLLAFSWHCFHSRSTESDTWTQEDPDSVPIPSNLYFFPRIKKVALSLCLMPLNIADTVGEADKKNFSQWKHWATRLSNPVPPFPGSISSQLFFLSPLSHMSTNMQPLLCWIPSQHSTRFPVENWYPSCKTLNLKSLMKTSLSLI